MTISVIETLDRVEHDVLGYEHTDEALKNFYFVGRLFTLRMVHEAVDEALKSENLGRVIGFNNYAPMSLNNICQEIIKDYGIEVISDKLMGNINVSLCKKNNVDEGDEYIHLFAYTLRRDGKRVLNYDCAIYLIMINLLLSLDME